MKSFSKIIYLSPKPKCQTIKLQKCKIISVFINFSALIFPKPSLVTTFFSIFAAFIRITKNTMTKTNSSDVKVLLNDIKEKVFKGVELSSVPTRNDNDWNKFLLTHSERLLSTRENRKLIMWLYSLYFDEENPTPLTYGDPGVSEYFSYKEIDGLSKFEMDFANICYYLAYFTHCMNSAVGRNFNVELFLGTGMDDDIQTDYFTEWNGLTSYEEVFSLDNKVLVDWIKTTNYRRVAAGVMSSMISAAGDRAKYQNPVEHDYFYGFFGSVLINMDHIEECIGYVNIGFETLTEAEHHRQRAEELGLSKELATIVDSLRASFTHNYPEKYVECAKVIQPIVSQMLPQDHLSMSVEKRAKWTSSVFRVINEEIKKFDIDLDTREYNLSMNYILDWLDLEYNAKMYDRKF